MSNFFLTAPFTPVHTQSSSKSEHDNISDSSSMGNLDIKTLKNFRDRVSQKNLWHRGG